ncbi:MAG: DMT family transporter [Firmicutes bacterium]|nr:DMT family transporter [Bacillota bacterium]
MNRSNSPLYIFVFLCSVASFAISGVFVKYSLLPATSTAFYRQLISLLLFPLVFKEVRGLTRRDILLMMAGGVFFGFNLIMWNYGLLHTTQANCNLLANMHIFATVPLSYLIYKEKIRKPFIIGTVIAFAGLVALLTGKADPGDGSIIGDIVAFLSSLLYGGYLMITYSVRDRMSALCAIELGAVGTMVTLLPAMLIVDGFTAPTSWAALWPILLIILFGQFGGVGLTSVALGHIRASMASMLALTQPAFGALLGLLLFREVLTWQEIAGILIIILGVSIAQRNKTEVKPDAKRSAA